MKILRSLTTTYTMNLLAKKFSLKKNFKPGLMILIPVFFGCETSDDLGIQYDLGSDANVRFQEFTLPATNIYIDSLRTDVEAAVLVGTYTDALTGTTSAEGYFNMFYENGPLPRKKATTSEPNPEDTIKLDSIVVLFESTVSIPGAGIVQQDFSLYELEDTLQTTAIYLSRLKQTPTTQIGTYNRTIDTETDTLHRVKLDDTYAQTFFDQLSDIAGDTTKSISTTVFKSLGVIPGPSSSGITSLNLASDTTRMIVYTSPLDNNDTTYLTSFQFNAKRYSYLDRNRTGSSFDGINEFENFDLPDGRTILDPLAGIHAVLSLSELEDFFNQNRNILINNATLEIDYDSEVERDTLYNFMNYLRKPAGNIFGPAIVINPFENIIMTDIGYLRRQSDPALSGLNIEKQIVMSSTLFYQLFYSNSIQNNDLLFQSPTSDLLIPINDLVAVAPASLSLQRAIFKSDGIKLKIYYTKVNR